MQETSIEFLKRLLDTPGPSGDEAAAARVWRAGGVRGGGVAGRAVSWRVWRTDGPRDACERARTIVGVPSPGVRNPPLADAEYEADFVSALAGWRLLRCNPWSHGGVDFAHDQTLFRPRRRHTHEGRA